MRRKALIAAALRCAPAVVLFGVLPVWAADNGPVPVIEARIDRVGLFAGAMPLVRSGCWSLVEVGLRHRGERPFEGELRVGQPDRDGDVSTAVTPVVLAPGAEWRDYAVYFTPQDGGGAGGSPAPIRLYDAAGRRVPMVDETGATVTELYGPLTQDVPPDDFLIVDLSSPRRLAHAAWLDTGKRRKYGWLNARHVRSMLPRELPQRWQGLDAVDAIVWNDADPSGLSPQQVEALVEWVREGGRLLITSGRNWQALGGSPLAAALPVRLTGIEERSEAQEFLDIVQNEEYGTRLARRYLRNPITRCRLEPLPGALPIPPKCPNPPIAYRRLLGRGVVTFVGASLNDLMPAPSRLRNLDDAVSDLTEAEDVFLATACERVLARRLLGLPQLVEDKDTGFGTRVFGRTDLYGVLRQSISFESVGATFVVFSVLFGMAYWFAATVGGHNYLKRRGWSHLSWTVFAGVSIASSLIGLVMVWGLRGVTTRLWQTSVIDAPSGSDLGRAVCLMGVRTGDHARLDLRLPVGDANDEPRRGGALRVAPESDSIQGTSSKYASADRYFARLAGEWLDDVPIRATLKEFQGNWHGSMGGFVDGRLIARRNTGADRLQIPFEFNDGSYIRNGLPVDLTSCYLLETDELVAGEGQNVLTRCYLLGDLPAGAELGGAALADRLYNLRDAQNPSAEPKRRTKLPLIGEELGRWGAAVTPLGAAEPGSRPLGGDLEYYTVLMLSFSDLIRPDGQGRPFVRRTHGRSLDCSRLLTPATAVLVGYSQRPGPAVLEVDHVALRPSKARTIYRFVIPVER